MLKIIKKNPDLTLFPGKFNPNKILAMGYAKIEGDKGVITSVKGLNKGDKVKIHLKDGSVTGEIL